MQDTYKVSSRLTLNLGLRYDLPFPYTEIHNRQTLWIPGRQSTVMPNAPEGLLYPGDKGVPAGLIPTFKKAFAPRVGVAWDPTGSGNWLVTSAYGIFYEPYYTGQGGPLQSPISAPPYLQTEQISLSPSQPLNFSDPYNGNPPPANSFATPLTNLTLAPNLPLPYTQDWDLNVQRSLGQRSFVGSWATWERREQSCHVLSKAIQRSTFRAWTRAAIRSRPPTTPTSGAFIQDARWRTLPARAITPRRA